MNINNIIRAWKDENYRLSLSAAEQAMLPENPAGALELSDAQLGAVSGAAITDNSTLLVICTANTFNNSCPNSLKMLACLPKPPTK